MAITKKNSRPQKPTRRSKAGANKAPKDPMHPGLTLAQVLEDTPLEVAAKWFAMTPDALSAVLTGKAPMTQAMAEIAGTVFGTGAAPWLMMIDSHKAEISRLAVKASEKAPAK